MKPEELIIGVVPVQKRLVRDSFSFMLWAPFLWPEQILALKFD